jgi:hypothetical protein
MRAAMGDWGQAADATLAVYEQAIKTMRQE